MSKLDEAIESYLEAAAAYKASLQSWNAYTSSTCDLKMSSMRECECGWCMVPGNTCEPDIDDVGLCGFCCRKDCPGGCDVEDDSTPLEKCIKSASVYTPISSNWRPIQCVIQMYQIETKLLELLEMVPRAGLEPARPILLYPRILSPLSKLCKSLLSLTSSLYFIQKVHQKCITDCSNRLQSAPGLSFRLPSLPAINSCGFWRFIEPSSS